MKALTIYERPGVTSGKHPIGSLTRREGRFVYAGESLDFQRLVTALPDEIPVGTHGATVTERDPQYHDAVADWIAFSTAWRFTAEPKA